MKQKDSWGIFCSSLCLIHCISTPFLMASGGLGVLGVMMSSEWVHPLLLVFVILFMTLSFPSAYKRHRQYAPSLLGLSGLVGLIIAMTLGHDFETVLTIISSSLLMIAHLWNQRLSSLSLIYVR
jgi:hypothetical protein